MKGVIFMEHKNLLEEVIENRLKKAKDDNLSEEEQKRAFKEAMEAVDRSIQLDKIASAENEQQMKLDLEIEKNELLKKEQKVNRIIKCVEVAAVPAALFIADCLFKRYYIRTVCNFEKDYTFTTTPGKSISGIFRFKK